MPHPYCFTVRDTPDTYSLGLSTLSTLSDFFLSLSLPPSSRKCRRAGLDCVRRERERERERAAAQEICLCVRKHRRQWEAAWHIRHTTKKQHPPDSPRLRHGFDHRVDDRYICSLLTCASGRGAFRLDLDHDLHGPSLPCLLFHGCDYDYGYVPLLLFRRTAVRPLCRWSACLPVCQLRQVPAHRHLSDPGCTVIQRQECPGGSIPAKIRERNAHSRVSAMVSVASCLQEVLTRPEMVVR